MFRDYKLGESRPVWGARTSSEELKLSMGELRDRGQVRKDRASEEGREQDLFAL